MDRPDISNDHFLSLSSERRTGFSEADMVWQNFSSVEAQGARVAAYRARIAMVR
jgi:hypothetical protein